MFENLTDKDEIIGAAKSKAFEKGKEQPSMCRDCIDMEMDTKDSESMKDVKQIQSHANVQLSIPVRGLHVEIARAYKEGMLRNVLLDKDECEYCKLN